MFHSVEFKYKDSGSWLTISRFLMARSEAEELLAHLRKANPHTEYRIA